MLIDVAKPGILPRFASKRSQRSCATFAAARKAARAAAAHPCAELMLQTPFCCL